MLNVLNKTRALKTNWRSFLAALLLAGLVCLTETAPPARAEAPFPGGVDSNVISPQQEDGSSTGRDADCLMCHTDHDFKGTFKDGEMISLYVDNGQFEQSVHGPAGLECLACHTDISRYPHHAEEQVTCSDCHPEESGTADVADTTLRVQLPFADRREMTLSINQECRSCHEEEFIVAADSAHVRVLKGGNRDAPVCVDCHGSHNITPPGEPRAKISHICGECHKAVYTTYRSSVHGAALDDESNPDVPTCTDCHGVHAVRGPRNPTFRDESINTCGGCHADKEMMDKYNISTNVFKTYLNDFHGRTVELFLRQKSGETGNEAVCFDCHGIHNIRKPDDPYSTVYPTNLQRTCQKCHTDANIKFPQAWMGHYEPTLEDTPVLYAVNTAYLILIPLTISGFLLYIGLDAHKRWHDKRQLLHQAVIQAEKELDDELKDDYDLS